MRTEWDYTELADSYLERPEYAPDALEQLFRTAGLAAGSRVCDIGAGVGHLTIPMAGRGFLVDAVEPNDAMRANGKKRTASLSDVAWFEGTGEQTGCPSGQYDFVSFGSSFNVCDRKKALQETFRLLKPGGWFACMWNHRDLSDPIQAHIEEIIKEYIPGYSYGSRREDQKPVITESGLFTDIQEVSGRVVHTQSVEKALEAWRSHATLFRQAQQAASSKQQAASSKQQAASSKQQAASSKQENSTFSRIMQAIHVYLRSLTAEKIQIPYTTRAWIAQRREARSL